MFRFLGPLTLLFALVLPCGAQENDVCLACHGESDFQTEREGKPVSLFTDRKRFEASVHGSLTCVSCHADLADAGLPHENPPEKVQCGSCHGDQEEDHAGSLHGAALERGDPRSPRCQTCHGSHGIRRAGDALSAVSPLRVPYLCGSCHREGAPVKKRGAGVHPRDILKNYSLNMHGESLLKKGVSVSATCTSCHTAHKILPHTDPASTISRDNVVGTCTKCHGDIRGVHSKIIKGELWRDNPAAVPVCADCHQPHKTRKVFYDPGLADKDCLRCHSRDIRRASDGKALRVEPGGLAGSVHSGVACAQCHKGVTASKSRPCRTVEKRVDCGVCHAGQSERFEASSHGKLLDKGDPNAPSCVECHGSHGVLAQKDSGSPTFPLSVPRLCAKCHEEGRDRAVRKGDNLQNGTTGYGESIHAKGLLESGLVVTAMCTSCHTAHSTLPAEDPASSVHKKNIAGTCAQCHHSIHEKYDGSVHSPKANKTGKELPTCHTCHNAHAVQRADKESFKLGILDRCGKCHMDVASTYFDTYHGKVSRLGSATAAKCHDCHGAHNVRAVADPKSTLSRGNVLRTCRKCHPGATRKFTGYLTHSTHHDRKKYPFVFWTFWGMESLLIGTFLFFGLHSLLWLPRSLQMRRAHPHKPAGPGEKYILRFKPFNRALHVTMILSFMTLALTGMSLKFSYTRWAVVLSGFLGGFETAGAMHRLAAMVMFGLFFVHLWDVIKNKRRECGGWKSLLFGPDTLLPMPKDLREFVATVKWYAGRGERPRYGRWTYWEKFDYFAVFWGVTIIGSSGLILWFPELFTRVLPGWLINVAGIIHGDEALLAVGFIFTIHFFNTHVRPEKFPMDTVIFTGRMPLDEFKRERPAEYSALKRSGELKDRIVAGPSPGALRAAKIFGWAALSVGVALVVGIIYALLSAYF